MKKTSESKKDEEMLPEYDFGGGVRGKHHRAYRVGHSVKVHIADRTITEQHLIVKDDAVLPEPDSKAV